MIFLCVLNSVKDRGNMKRTYHCPKGHFSYKINSDYVKKYGAEAKRCPCGEVMRLRRSK